MYAHLVLGAVSVACADRGGDAVMFGKGRVIDFTSGIANTANTGQFVAAISAAAFGDPEPFGAGVERVFDEMRHPLPGHDRVGIPGEGRSVERQRNEVGIPPHANLAGELRKIADETGVAFPV